MTNTLTQAQRTIADFLISDFGSLERLYTDAKAGKIVYYSCDDCLVGHSDQGWNRPLSEVFEVSEAYRDLGYSSEQLVSDAVRINRLIPLIEAEMARRAALRAEVVARAKEAVLEGEGVTV